MAARDQKISQPTHSYPQMRYRSVFDTNFNVISATNQLCMWSKCYPNCILFIGHSKRQPYIVDSIKIYFICNQFALNFQKQKPKKKTNERPFMTQKAKQYQTKHIESRKKTKTKETLAYTILCKWLQMCKVTKIVIFVFDKNSVFVNKESVFLFGTINVI